jgi:subfamily B ATP-binding cassette protein MsbA
MVLFACFNVEIIRVVKPILDEVWKKGVPDVKVFGVSIYWYIALIFLGRAVFGYISQYLMIYVGQSAVMDMRNALYRNIQNRSMRFFMDMPTGVLISRVTNDIEQVNTAVSDKLCDLLKESMLVLGLAIYLIYLDWKLFFVTFIGAPILIYPIIHFGKKLRRSSYMSQQEMGNLASILHEGITGIRIVKAFCMEEFEIRKFRQALRNLFRINLKIAKVIVVTPHVMEFVAGVLVALLVLYGKSRIDSGTTTAGQMVSFGGALFLMYNPIKKLSRVHNALQQALAAVDRVYEVLDLEEDIREKKDAVDLPALKGKVEFVDVSFRYGEADILKKVNLSIEPGEIVAIVGSSGAGKSTLVNLIPRFYDPSAGTVLLDGFDIRDVKLASLRRQVALVTQEVILFNETVENNIAYGQQGVPRDTVQKAASVAYAHEFIEGLPDGYRTVIGEKGMKLSGGERQRIAIARAALKDAPILILDEATSALDAESERIVQNALLNIIRGRTTIIIAHRLSTIRLVDKIVVIEDGEVKEIGTHQELLRKNGIYSKFYELQNLDSPAAHSGPESGEEES